MTSHTAQLAAFAAGLRFEDIPAPVVSKIEDLLVDWFGSVVAGHGARPVEAEIEQNAEPDGDDRQQERHADMGHCRR